MPIPIQNFNITDFSRITQDLGADQNVVLKESGFAAKGKVGTFFAGKAASRNAAEALYSAIRKEYGSTIADTLSPSLRDSLSKGKPLSARTVQQVLVEAQEYRRALRNANTAAVCAFCMGDPVGGDASSLSGILTPFCRERGISADYIALRDELAQFLTEKAALSDKILSFQDLKEAVQAKIGDLEFTTPIIGSHFSAIPAPAQQALLHGMKELATHLPEGPERESKMQMLKNDFYGLRPATYNMAAGMEAFTEKLVASFLDPAQQGKIKGGIHERFVQDAHMGSISRMDHFNMAAGQDPEDYEEALKLAVPQEYHQFLPFISMMSSQIGMQSASSLLPHLSGLVPDMGAHLTEAGLSPTPHGATHDMQVFTRPFGLTIDITFTQPFARIDDDQDQPVLLQEGRLTMEIDFSEELQRHMVDGKEVLIPHFELTDGEAHFRSARN